ncbi:hypothetical protein GPECTOR_2g1595 [Gonium pectorale]|uniref:Uncharacterized protein n=1 Tax=Gonium pectorale TaxID=33097 RepID=A0A150H202_GONPE|nr:hypothetical protein GPECTOR_2g1595 [Gonium pectorale]|eukprot:KXZ56043.1 hypothetical protein GPECTOR_2g1595 [Gonium pectorale]
MKNVLQVMDEDKARREASQRGAVDRPPDIILNTDLRAYERLTSAEAQRADVAAQRAAEEAAAAAAAGGADGGRASGPLAAAAAAAQAQAQQARDFSLLSKNPEMRRKMLEQRQRMLQYAAGVNLRSGAPGIKPLNLPAIRSKVAANWRDHGRGTGDGGGEDGSDGGAALDGNLWEAPQPAEWRLRMHAARRRALLLVGAAARWQVALSRRPGPKRLPRVNSFSYYIPQVLGDEAPRFIEEAKAVAKIKADAAAKQWGPEEAAIPEQPDSPAPILPRGPPRRGMSDSGFTATAAAAVAAVGSGGGGAAAADSAAPAPAPAPVVSGGAGAAGPLASGVVRPRKLGKSSSDKALPDPSYPYRGGRTSASGHISDADVRYGGPRRPRSGSSIGGPRLPAISGGSGGGRVSASGAGGGHGYGYGRASSFVAAGDGTPPPAAAPRPPCGKLSRVSSTAQGRASRRQSDSALAMAKGVPASIAAAAAAAAAAMGDAGALCLQQAAAATAGGAGSAAPSPKPKRGSETGGGGGSTAVPDSPGFLPPLPGSGGSGSNSGAPCKPLTVSQARRLALLAEVGGAGPEDVSRLNSMSPSRLGPLKLASE